MPATIGFALGIPPFHKKLRNHEHHNALHFLHYNYCRIHKSLRVSPAMAAGVTNVLRDTEWIVELIDARAPKPAKPGPKGPWKHKQPVVHGRSAPQTRDKRTEEEGKMTQEQMVAKLAEMIAWGEAAGGQKMAAAVLFGVLFDEDIRRWNDQGVDTLARGANLASGVEIRYGRKLAEFVSPNYSALRRWK